MKKVTVKSELIKKALSKLGAAVSSRAVLPALENIFCSVEGNTISMTTCDTEMMVKYTLPVGADEPCDFYLRYNLFKNIVGLCKEEDIEFEPLKTSVKVKCGKDVFTLKFNAKLDEFPKLSKAPGQHAIALDNKHFDMMLAATESASKSEATPCLTRICLNINHSGIDIVGTDGFILYKYNLPEALDVTTTLLLSSRMVKAIEGLEQIIIRWDDKKFSFSTADVLIVVNRPEYKYPNYLSIIPESTPNLKLTRTVLTETFKKLNIYSTKTAALQLSSTAIKAQVDDRETGDKVNAEMECTYSGEVPEIALNAADLLRLLHQTTCEDLELSILASNKAVVIRGEDPNYLALIIPIFNK